MRIMGRNNVFQYRLRHHRHQGSGYSVTLTVDRSNEKAGERILGPNPVYVLHVTTYDIPLPKKQGIPRKELGEHPLLRHNSVLNHAGVANALHHSSVRLRELIVHFLQLRSSFFHHTFEIPGVIANLLGHAVEGGGEHSNFAAALYRNRKVVLTFGNLLR